MSVPAQPSLASSETTPEVILITGLSGAGRGSSAKILEDLGWYVVDNVPIPLIPQLILLDKDTEAPVVKANKLAVVLDVRTHSFTGDTQVLLQQLADLGIAARILFLDASDAVLIRRFEHVKRRHPLQKNDTLSDGITRERALLAPLREGANTVVDTSFLSVHDLRVELERRYYESAHKKVMVTVQSFGFKNGIPMDIEMLFDVRFIPNPHWIEKLRPLNGLDQEVSGYVLAQKNVDTYISSLISIIEIVLDGYRKEGKDYLSCAIGCTGGKHRSVAVAQELGRRLASLDGINCKVKHRDLGME